MGAIGLALGVSACATVPTGGITSRDNRVEVVRQGERLHLAYHLDREAAVWAFTDSALTTEGRRPWRHDQWRVLTPGVVLDRSGHYDVLISVDGTPVPRLVEIESRPQSVDLEAEYRTLIFSNGAVAVPSRQVNLFPADSLEAVADMPADLNGVDLPTPPIEASWRDEAGPVLYQAQSFPRLTTRFERSYILMGDVPVTRDEGLAAVLDPALPDWLSQTLTTAAPATGRWFRQRLGPAASGSDRPVIMVAWSGPTQSKTSMSGSVLPGQIAMIFEGGGILQPDAEIRERTLWFIAHEAAHFWLGQTVAYEYARDAWITEGGADLLAVRALKGQDPAYDDLAELQKEVDDCARLARQPIVTAADRGEHRAYYACGAVFGMAAEAAQKRRTGGDFSHFIKGLIDQNREDGVLTREEWLSALAKVAGRDQVRAPVERLLDQGATEPSAVMADLFTQTGVRFRMEAGRVVLLP